MKVSKLYCDICNKDFSDSIGLQNFALPVYSVEGNDDYPHFIFNTIQVDVCDECLQKIVSVRYSRTEGRHKFEYSPIPAKIAQPSIGYAKIDFGGIAKILGTEFVSSKINNSYT